MTTGHRWQARLRGPLALVMVALAAHTLAVASVASAQTSEEQTGPTTLQPPDAAPTTFISNLGQQDPDGVLTHGGTVFQGFTTGSNPAGYSLSEIIMLPQTRPPEPEPLERSVQPGPQPSSESARANTRTEVEEELPALQPSVEIWSQKGNRITMPDKLLYRLISPPSVPLDEEVAFQTPPETVLAPNTAYYARIINAVQVGIDTDREVGSGTADGWILDNGLMYQSNGASAWTRYAVDATISVRGFALPEPTQ